MSQYSQTHIDSTESLLREAESLLSGGNSQATAAILLRMREEITTHNLAYYQAARPLIPDHLYDLLLSTLSKAEQHLSEIAPVAEFQLLAQDSASPTRTVGAPIVGDAAPVKHVTKMLSIDNTYESAGIETFVVKIETAIGHPVDYSLEPKFDGLTLGTVYEYGRLASAATGGDGETGESVLATAGLMASIPKEIAALRQVPRFEARGEVILPRQAFTIINQTLAASGAKTFINERNAAAGILRRKYIDPTEASRLIFVAFAITQDTLPADVTSQTQAMDRLRQLGFVVSTNVRTAKTVEQINRLCERFGEIRDQLPYVTDGLVIKVNDFAVQERLGATSRFPRSMLAFKYNEQEAWTTVLGISRQVGRTGAVTPVAELKPVTVGDVTVSSATLHNQNEIDRLGIRIGDTVLVRRNGDVIPGIVQVDESKRAEWSAPYKMPESCPCCSGNIAPDDEDAAVMRCGNGIDCEEQAIGALLHFGSRQATNIDGLGEQIVRQMFASHLVHRPDDIYHLTVDDIAGLERKGVRSARNLITEIEKSKTADLWRFIHGLGIRHVGESTAKALAKQFGTLDAFLAVSEQDLVAVEDVGPETTASIIKWRDNNANLQMVKRMQAAGVAPAPGKAERLSDALEGKRIVVTGTVPGHTRETIAALIEAHGGLNTDSVSKKTDFLVAGENAGSKLEKANKLGVPVIDGAALEALIEARMADSDDQPRERMTA